MVKEPLYLVEITSYQKGNSCYNLGVRKYMILNLLDFFKYTQLLWIIWQLDKSFKLLPKTKSQQIITTFNLSYKTT
jgi:hypothetical protein